MVQQFQVAIDGGTGAGLLRIYTATQPSTGGTPTTLLAEQTFSDPCAPSASGGVLTMSAITADSAANATGTPTWGRAVDSAGTFCMDFTAGISGTDLILNASTITINANVSTSSMTITAGNL